MTIKNRGAISNPEGRFEKDHYEAFDDGWWQEVENLPPLATTLFPEKAKSIISRNDSPDICFEQSINPYRGCEHGCVYCYARPCHAYVNLSPGLDFETKIFYKEHAAQLLEKQLNSPRYVCKPIVLSGNTDPYQPSESKLNITRQLLTVLQRYQHPVSIITKGTLIERDLDILTEMASKNLVRVAISITTLSAKLKYLLEPRAAAPKARLRIIEKLTAAHIPVTVMAAPMIPMINDMELDAILKAAHQAGARHAGYVLIRLPHEVKDIFKEWLTTHFPERAEHVMSLIRQMRNGKEYDATFGKRGRGEGLFATLLNRRFRLACMRYQLNTAPSSALNTQAFTRPQDNKQLPLF